MSSSVRQTSFATGELSRFVQGRTDLDLFRHGARKLLNFVVNRQGSAVSRPGTRRCWTAKTPQIVLVPFLLPDSTSARILEFGNLYVRIYDAGLLTLVTELVTPFVTGDLAKLQWAQSGEILTVTVATREPQEITITATTATIFPVRYGPPGDAPGDAPLQAVFPSIGGNPPAMPVLAAWQPLTLFVVDAAHPPREWQYKVSTLIRHNVSGLVVETLPRDVTDYSFGDQTTGNVSAGPILPLPADGQLILFSDAPIYIAPGLGAAIAAPANWTVEEYVYYRGRGRLFGLVGSTRTNANFADFGDEPDYLTPPLRGESPFKAGEYPAAVAFFQQRRALAGTRTRGNTWWASAVGELANFDEPVLNWPGQPLQATLIGDKRETIVSMVQIEHLFVLTDSAVWCIGRKEVPLDYDTFPSLCRVVDRVGSLALPPLVIDGSILVYPRSEGRGLRALVPNGEGVTGADISWHAEHLFIGRNSSIRSWCYQRDPWGVAWVVRDDGTLLSVTRGGDGAWAWAKHETDNQVTPLNPGGDQILSVVSVPGEHVSVRGDDVFMAVIRGGTTYIERLTPSTTDTPPRYPTAEDYEGNDIGSPQATYPLDSYVTATVFKDTGAIIFGALNLFHLEGRDVWASCPGLEPLGPLRVTLGTVTIPPGSWGPTNSNTFTAAFGLPYVCDLGLLDAAPGTLNQKTVVKVGFEVDNAVGLQVGEDFDHLVPWQQRRVADAYAFPSAASTLVDVMVKGSWNQQGRAVLRQAKPLPVTVLGITRELASGGK